MLQCEATNLHWRCFWSATHKCLAAFDAVLEDCCLSTKNGQEKHTKPTPGGEAGLEMVKSFPPSWVGHRIFLGL